MGDFLDVTRAVIPPMEGDQVPGHFQPQRLSGTGTAEAVNERALSKGRIHDLIVGAAAVRVSFRAVGGASDQVATTSTLIPANTIYPFLALLGPDNTWGSIFVYVEAGDGAADYEAFVVQRAR
jgi:hypothetical protein